MFHWTHHSDPFALDYSPGSPLDAFIRNALAEDIGPGDITCLTTLPADYPAVGRCIVKSDGVLAGVHFAQQVFTKLDSGVQFHALCADGDKVSVGTVAFTVETNAHTLLGAERLVLNVMQHLSGIATTTHQLVQALEGTGCRVLDTRKTIPLNRILEKWAVRVGGGVNHRFGLFDQVLIKDNHIDAVGDIRATLRRCRAELDRMGVDVPIVVECRTLAHVQVAVETGIPHRLLLDNMSPTQLKEAVQWVNGRLPLEASGGITPENARQYAETGVDFLSMGALTHTVKPLDISLKIQS